MKWLVLALGTTLAVGCGDDSPTGGSPTGGASAGGASAGGSSAGGSNAGGGGAAQGGAAPQGFCADTVAVGSCPTLTGCPDLSDAVADALCGCAAAQEGESCQVSFDGGEEGCGFSASCIAGEWLEELPP